jgi:hypothetical protein
MMMNPCPVFEQAIPGEAIQFENRFGLSWGRLLRGKLKAPMGDSVRDVFIR